MKRLWDAFRLPVFTLVDADPHGNLSGTIWDNSPVLTSHTCDYGVFALRTFAQCIVWARG